MKCPICNFEVTNKRGLASHFRHQSDTHPDYNQWSYKQKWKDKTENIDYVKCLECGHKAETLARHLKASHNITAEDYKKKHDQDILIRIPKLTKKRSKAAKNRKKGFGKGDTKIIKCPSCDEGHKVSKFLGQTHDMRCEYCQKKEEEAKWGNLSEPEDYITCLICGYRSESIVSHINNTHPDYIKKFPTAYVVSLTSSVRDKSHQIGKRHSEETKKKMSENAGKWNLGLTKETNKTVARISKLRERNNPWNKGLDAKSHPSIANTVEKLKYYVGENRPWDNGLAVNLTLEDFIPFMDSEGRVDHHAIIKATGLNWVTIHKYIRELSLEKTKKYIKERAEEATTRLEKEILEQFKLKNGKVSIAKAISELGYSFKVIKRECQRHGLETFNRKIRQTICLDIVSEALGGVKYKDEWESMKFCNPKTGRRFKFDGYFKSIGLIVEFHGHQHYMFPNAFMYKESHEKKYLEMRERDNIKKEMIVNDPDLTYFSIREDEPFDDVAYVKSRLLEAVFSK